MIVMPACFNAGDTIYFFFDTYDSNGASVTMSGLAVTDIEVYKNGSVTQRSSDNGYTLLDTDGIDFDGTTGLHGFSIDTSDNTDAGFWADGNQYLVNVNAITIDSQTVRFSYFLALGYTLRPTTAGRKLDVSSGGEAGVDWANVGSPTTTVNLSGTTIATTQQVDVNTIKTQSVTCAAGVTVLAHVGFAATPGAASGGFMCGTNAPVTITGSGNALTLTSTGGNGHGLAVSGNGSGEGLSATGGATGHGIQAIGGATSGTGLYCMATTSGAGIAGIAAGNNNGIEGDGAGSGAGLAATGGASGDGFHIEGQGSSHGMHVVADSGNGFNFTVTSGGDIVGDITGSLSGSVGSVTGAVGSVTGAVGSVTGNVGGNVVGSVASVSGAVGSVTGNVGGNVTGSVGSVATGGISTASFAAGAIDAAAIAADAIDADSLKADAVTEIQSGLATAANLATVAGYLDTEIAAILADTNELQTDWADGGRLDAILDARASQASVDDLPTNAELATALGTADDAVLAAIAALSIPTAAQNAAALMDLADGVEVGLTPRQAFRLLAAAAFGKLSGAATTTIVIRNAVADSKDRITATVDADGNRSAITVDLT